MNQVPTEAMIPGGTPDASIVDAIRRIMMGENANPARSTLDIGRARAGGPMAQPTPPPNPNAGGRLAPASPSPQNALARMMEQPESVSLPEQPQPGINYSPDARAALAADRPGVPRLEDIMRRREQGAAANRFAPDVQVVDEPPVPTGLGSYVSTGARVSPQAGASMIDQLREGLSRVPTRNAAPTVAPIKRPSAPRAKTTTAESPEALFKKLSAKAILTEEEANVLARLKSIMQGRASNIGLSYAAGVK